MRVFSIVCSCMLSLLLYVAGPADANEKQKIIVGGDHENPPYEFLENGKATGFNVDLMRAVADAIGAELEIRLGPWDDVRRELKEGKIDALAGMYYSEERSKAVDFSVPHTMVSAGLFVRGNSQIRTIEDIKGKEVIVQKGDVIDDYLRENGITPHIIEVRDPADELRLLDSGRHDCALMPSRFQGEYLRRALGISNVRGISANLPQFRYCFAVKKGNDPLRFKLDEGLNILKVNGRYQEIYNKWFGVYEKSRLWRTLRYFVWALALIAGLLAASSIWSWFLRREVRKRTAELRKSEEDLRHAHDELEQRVIERTAELRRAKELLEEEISVRNRTERVITARLRLLELAATHSLDNLLEATINEVEALTGSSIGFFHFLEADQKTLSLQNWSTRTKAELCRAEGRGLHCDVSTAGVWVDCIRERRPVIHNDYASLPHRKGMPPELTEVVRELVLPVFRGDSIVAIIGVGNKPHDYTSEDIEAVSFLADLAWEITERKRAEEALHLSQFCIDKAGIGIYQSDETGAIFSVNEHACNSLGYSKEELCSLSVFDIDPEITPERMLELKEILDETGTTTHYSTHLRRDGSTFPVEITANHLDFQGKRYGISFVKDITKRKRMEEALRESESRVRRKLESILDPEGDIGELELADIIDAPEIQALMDDLYRNTGLKMSIIDLGGRVMVDVGWQEICLKFHRNHPETLKRCTESDTDLTIGVPQGEFKTYRCRNNMWHLVTPIIVGGRHMGNLFMGQFFFDNEELDYDLFRAQARIYGFPEEEYMAALEAVPRHSEECVNKGKAFFLRLIDMFSKLSYGNIKLSHLLAERDRLTATLRESEAQLKIAMDLAKLVPWEYDVRTGLFTFDDQFYALYGTTAEQEGGTLMPAEVYVRKFIPPEESAIVAKGIEEVRANSYNQLEHKIIRADGEERFIVVRGEAVFDQQGSFVKIRGANQDITERKQAEEQLILQKMQLKELNSTLEERVREEVSKNREKDVMLIQQNRQAALGEILDHIAHQWKQPLNAIAIITYLLKDNDSLSMEEVNETADKILGQVEHMSQTANLFRDFYRPDKEKSLFLIKESIDMAVSILKPALQYESVEVEVEADPKLAALGYPKEFAQVLLNLLGNARDAFREKKVEKPRLNIKGIAEGDMAVVTVTDNAGGICEEAIASIFDMNFTTKEASGGTGVGLYMAKNIIERHMGGELTAENVFDGARFSIRLGIAASDGNKGA